MRGHYSLPAVQPDLRAAAERVSSSFSQGRTNTVSEYRVMGAGQHL